MAEDIELLEFAINLARTAGQVALPLFRQDLVISSKLHDGFDPVTQADRAAEAAMRKCIEQTFPGHGIIGEEFGVKPPDSEYAWILDPIDGTRSFICGTPTWMTLIALTRNGKPVAGVASQPFTGEIFAGTPKASYLLHNGKKLALATTTCCHLNEVLAGTTAPALFRKNGHETRLENLQAGVRHMRFDADAYFHCMVAAGQLGVSLDTGLQSYDIAALVPIIEGAGGIVTTWQGADARDGGDILAAANRSLHEQAMALLA